MSREEPERRIRTRSLEIAHKSQEKIKRSDPQESGKKRQMGDETDRSLSARMARLLLLSQYKAGSIKLVSMAQASYALLHLETMEEAENPGEKS